MRPVPCQEASHWHWPELCMDGQNRSSAKNPMHGAPEGDTEDQFSARFY